MRQSEHPLTRICLPLTHRLRQVALHSFPQMPFLRISPNQQSDLYIFKEAEQVRAPCLRAPFHRRNIPAILVISRKAKPHRHNRNAAFIIKRVLIHAHPIAKPHSGRVGKWPPALHRQIPRSLPGHKHLRRCRHRKHRPRRHAHIRFAKLASAYLGGQL